MNWGAAGVVLLLLLGGLVGWFAGWIARTDENKRWAESCRRRIEHAENEARAAWAEVGRLDAQLSIPVAAGTPVINVNLTAPAMPVVPSYRDLAGAAAQAVAREMRVIEAAP